MKTLTQLFVGIIFLIILLCPSKIYATECCTSEDCGGSTCAGAAAPCPPSQLGGDYGSCTLGGAECGPGVGGSCPAPYSCSGGNCVDDNGNPPPDLGGGWTCTQVPDDCPAGTTRSNVIISQACLGPRDRCNLGTAEVLTTTDCGCGWDAYNEWSCNKLVNTYRCDPVATATPVPGGCGPYEGCSTDHPTYTYNYSPVCSVCSLGCEGKWPIWRSDYSQIPGRCGYAAAPTAAPAYVRISVVRDPDNTCTAPSSGVFGFNWLTPTPTPFYGWPTSDPAYNTSVRLSVDSSISSNYSGGVYRGPTVLLGESGGSVSVRSSSSTTHTVYLDETSLPSGYRCSDGAGCPACPTKTGVHVESSTEGRFYITNNTPPATVESRAVPVTPSDTSCAAIKGVSTSDGRITGTTLGFTSNSASVPASKTQTGSQYAVFSSVLSGSYTATSTPPDVNWSIIRACWTNQTTGATGEGLTASVGANETLRFDIGYVFGLPWTQTNGGNVYASATLRSYIPNITPRVFNADGDGGYPGVVTYGTAYDFDSDVAAQGNGYISREGWLVNTNRTRVNYYDYFYRMYGSPTSVTTDASFSNLLAVTQPPSSGTPYYVVGDMTTSGNWSVGNGESLVIIVNGNLTLGGRINSIGSGFVAFIVNGTITVSDAVGTTITSTTPVIEGVYVAMNANQTGGFVTGTSVTAATARFVGKGVFIADTFTLQRDLDGYGVGNTGSSAELFIYNPRLLLTMPEEMKEHSVTWQEVTP